MSGDARVRHQGQGGGSGSGRDPLTRIATVPHEQRQRCRGSGKQGGGGSSVLRFSGTPNWLAQGVPRSAVSGWLTHTSGLRGARIARALGLEDGTMGGAHLAELFRERAEKGHLKTPVASLSPFSRTAVAAPGALSHSPVGVRRSWVGCACNGIRRSWPAHGLVIARSAGRRRSESWKGSVWGQDVSKTPSARCRGGLRGIYLSRDVAASFNLPAVSTP
jgi:hypothetical protein